ncbi:unnamed protein product [Lota lota]
MCSGRFGTGGTAGLFPARRGVTEAARRAAQGVHATGRGCSLHAAGTVLPPTREPRISRPLKGEGAFQGDLGGQRCPYNTVDGD